MVPLVLSHLELPSAPRTPGPALNAVRAYIPPIAALDAFRWSGDTRAANRCKPPHPTCLGTIVPLVGRHDPAGAARAAVSHDVVRSCVPLIAARQATRSRRCVLGRRRLQPFDPGDGGSAIPFFPWDAQSTSSAPVATGHVAAARQVFAAAGQAASACLRRELRGPPVNPLDANGSSASVPLLCGDLAGRHASHASACRYRLARRARQLGEGANQACGDLVIGSRSSV